MLVTAPVAATSLKERVLHILERHCGRRNSIKGMEIAFQCELRDDRAVQMAIEELIEDGEVIASSVTENKLTGVKMGYYIPESVFEEEDYMHQLRGRALGVFHRYKRFRVNCKRKHDKARQEQFQEFQPTLL